MMNELKLQRISIVLNGELFIARWILLSDGLIVNHDVPDIFFILLRLLQIMNKNAASIDYPSAQRDRVPPAQLAD